MSSACPPWLQNAFRSHSHIDNVLQTLNKRELRRGKARAASRRTTTHPVVSYSSPNAYSIAVGSLPENQPANRYMDIQPFDRTRVILGGGEERYINASWVRELYGGKWWIASQAPMPNTAHAFLSILLQPQFGPPESLANTNTVRPGRVRTVVQLTLAHEGGRVKAHPYFPSQIGQRYVVPSEDGCDAPSLEVTLLDYKDIREAKCIQSTVGVAYSTESNSGGGTTFRHLLYTAWPDHGVPDPEDRMSLLRFIRLVMGVNCDPSNKDLDPPIMVGCSAGIGRTGAFIALSSLLRAHGLLTSESGNNRRASEQSIPPLPVSQLGPLPAEIAADEVAAEIDSLREQRPGMVQRDEQALLVYELLQDAFSEGRAL